MELHRADGSGFTADQARPILEALHMGFSFALGHWVAPMLPVGLDSQGHIVWEEWAVRFCDPAKAISAGWWTDWDSEALRTSRQMPYAVRPVQRPARPRTIAPHPGERLDPPRHRSGALPRAHRACRHQVDLVKADSDSAKHRHVVIFDHWTDGKHTGYWAHEQVGGGTQFTTHNYDLTGDGYHTAHPKNLPD